MLKVDDGETFRFDAEAYQHNDKYADFKADIEEGKRGSLLKSLGAAKKKILTGLHVESLDIKQSIDIPPSGTANAVSQFVKACEIS